MARISESEWMIMNRLWEASELTAAELVERIQQERTLEPTTIKTLLRRLIAKGAVHYTVDPKNSKLYHYRPAVERQDCVRQENRQFLSLYHRNDLRALFASFLDDAHLSEEEAAQLRLLLERKEGKSRD